MLLPSPGCRVGEIHETRRGLPGDPDEIHRRYIEAAVNGLLAGGLYLTNGNPKPGPKFEYKLLWFERLCSQGAAYPAHRSVLANMTVCDAMPTRKPLRAVKFATVRLRLLKVAAGGVATVSRIPIAFASACPNVFLVCSISLTLRAAGR